MALDGTEILQLDTNGPLAGNEYGVLVQDGKTVKVLLSALTAYVVADPSVANVDDAETIVSDWTFAENVTFEKTLLVPNKFKIGSGAYISNYADGKPTTVISDTTGLDLTVAGAKTLQAALIAATITAIEVIPTTVTGVTVFPTAKAGVATDDEAIMTTVEMTALTVARAWTNATAMGVLPIVALSDALSLTVTTPATATALVARVRVHGRPL
jgi:hypothetical protein